MSGTMQQVVFQSHPRGNPRPGDFAVECTDIPSPADGEVLLKTLWLSLDRSRSANLMTIEISSGD